MKNINLCGIRKQAILCPIDSMHRKVAVMKPLTVEQEIELKENLHIELNGIDISKSSIYCYGSINFNNKEDIEFIERFDLISREDNANFIHCNYDYEKGTFPHDKGIAKMLPTLNAVEWFKYNHLLIGKPERIIVYACNKCDL